MQAVWLLIIADIYIYAKIDLNDPALRKTIISQAVEVIPEKQADGTFLHYQPLARSPYKGTGWVVIYFDDGNRINSLMRFKDGKKAGLATFWHDNGQKKEESNWKDGKKDGVIVEYDILGKETYRAVYSKGFLQESR